MSTNFFNQIQQLDFTGVLQLNISKGAADNLIVSVLLHNEQCGDNAKKLIPPLTFNATPQEFDEGFFEQINAPVQKASGLMVDMEKFLKQLEEVQKQSAMEKEKSDKETKEKDAKDRKFKDAMAKADELETAGKFREAWMKVPPTKDFPEKADEIRKRQTELSNKFGTPSLFGTEEEAAAEPNKETLYPEYASDTVEEEMEFENEDEQEY